MAAESKDMFDDIAFKQILGDIVQRQNNKIRDME